MEVWEDPQTPFIWLLGGTLLFLTLLVFIWIYVRNHIRRIREEERKKNQLKLDYQASLLSRSIEIQEKERGRIAANLHDDLIGQLHLVKMQNHDPALADLLCQSIKTAREISHDLTPPLLEQLRVTELMGDYLDPLRTQYTFHTDWGMAEVSMEGFVKLQVFRIFQELITNITKHAEATKVLVKWRPGRTHAFLQVQDNGIGFQNSSGNGLGMKNIEMRAQVLEAEYRYFPGRPQGTSFLIKIPLKHG